MTMFKMNANQIRKEVINCMEAGIVCMITSSPGLGKSSIVAQIARDFGLQLIDLRLSQCGPEDMMGLPMRTESGRAAFAPFEIFPLQGDPIPKGKNGWLLFLDEFNSASTAVQKAAYKLALDRYVGQAKLHDDVYVVAAGNLATDRALVSNMSTAMQSRLVHLEMLVDHKSFMDHAVKEGFDHRILGFLEFQPSKLHTFKPDHSDSTFACPRTWEFASKLLKGKASRDVSVGLLAGAISDGVAVELVEFMKAYEDLPSFSKICSNPEEAPVPTATGTRYACVTMLLSRFSEDTFKDTVKYVNRMPPEIQVIYLRGVYRLDPNMRRNPDYMKFSKTLVRFLNDDDDFDTQRAA